MISIFKKIKDTYRQIAELRAEWKYHEWRDEHINPWCVLINNKYSKFDYVFPVDPDIFFVSNVPGLVVSPQFSEYFWPHRPLATVCIWACERVYWDATNNSYIINELGGKDMVFIGCNNSADALMFSLLGAYSK